METLIYFALWAGMIFLMMRIGCGAHVMGHRQHRSSGRQNPQAGQDTVRWVPPETDTDPVCGKTVRPDQAKPSVHGGMVYYFCSRECRERFEAAPDLHLAPEAGPQVKRLGAADG
ncbi:YHS domain-containing protein [Pelagibius sp. CAU 1746]|uniref:YHS domain-containing protein n=1 Tax=Pelagibius sp. CAU 1746 TaxID=3140370 RepID=UPI00325AF099